MKLEEIFTEKELKAIPRNTLSRFKRRLSEISKHPVNAYVEFLLRTWRQYE